MKQCVYCDKTTDLNTQLTIRLSDDKKVTVDICDDHAEEATIKSAREAYEAKQAKIQEFIAQARLLGLDVKMNESGLSLAQEQSNTQPEPQSEKPAENNPGCSTQIVTDAVFESGNDMIDADSIRPRKMQSVGGDTEIGYVPGFDSHDVSNLSDKLPPEVLKGKVKMTMAEGRGGNPIAIPQTRIDGTGRTTIVITKSETDRTLQDRFKKMADESMDDRGPNFARSGYTETNINCPLCKATGTIDNKNESVVCPKCKGIGLIPRV